jgi:glycosyltransferase involved in cell wall biosynthesis
MPKILHLTADSSGGAGIAASRLVMSLNKFTLYECSLGVIHSCNDSDYTLPLPFYYQWLRKFEHRVLRLQKKGNRTPRSLGLFSSNLHKIVNSSDYDVVHLHWINKNMLSISDIAKINKPIIWTLHDMWPFCGTEHYSNDKRYQDGYPSKNGELRSAWVDVDRYVYLKKCASWKRLRLNLACPSQWINRCANASKIFGEVKSKVIPNGVDINLFKSIPKDDCRKQYGVATGKYTILFGAVNSTNDIRKGYLELQGAIVELCNRGYRSSIELVIFGAGDDGLGKALPCDVKYLGNVENEKDMPRVYNCADVFVGPSKQDNLPNTMVEAQSCGVPVVAFDIGGISDIVEHEVTGYLASAFSVYSLADGIEWCMKNTKVQNLQNNARERSIRLFNHRVTALAYQDYYQQIIEDYKYV